VASLFKEESWQLEFAYFPDDGSGTYVINVETLTKSFKTNTTKALPGIPSKDASATYAASINSLVSSSSGGIQYMPYNPSGDNSGAQWTAVQKLASLKAAASTGTKPTGTSSSGSTRTSGNGNGNGTGNGNTTSTGSNSAGALKAGREVVLGMMGALMLGSFGVFML
ncbi:hypothetical protein MPER_05719, partial [Moniliophthora perniciosa FA553]